MCTNDTDEAAEPSGWIWSQLTSTNAGLEFTAAEAAEQGGTQHGTEQQQ